MNMQTFRERMEGLGRGAEMTGLRWNVRSSKGERGGEGGGKAGEGGGGLRR